MDVKKLFIVAVFGVFVVGCAARQSASTSQLMSDKAAVQYQFAYDFYVQNQKIRALRAVLEAIKISPKNPDARNLLGLIYFRQGKLEQGVEEFKKAIALDPKLSEIHNNLGTLYYEQKRYVKALASLKNALENPLYLYPERIYNNLGLVHMAMGDAEKARESYERAITLRSDFFLPYLNLAKLWMGKGETARAKALFQQTINFCRDCSEPYYHLGSLLLKERQKKAAFKHFKKGFAVDPKGYYGLLCKQQISQK